MTIKVDPLVPVELCCTLATDIVRRKGCVAHHFQKLAARMHCLNVMHISLRAEFECGSEVVSRNAFSGFDHEYLQVAVAHAGAHVDSPDVVLPVAKDVKDMRRSSGLHKDVDLPCACHVKTG